MSSTVREDLADHDQAGALIAGQIDLGDVAGDHHLRPEAEPGQEHLHLLRARVLRLVEDHERVVQGVMGQQQVVGDVQRVGCRDLNADGLRLALGLDRIDEPCGVTPAVALV